LDSVGVSCLEASGMRIHDRQEPIPASGADQLSVFSWNLLAPSYNESSLPWDTVRLPALRKWLTRFAACDVICVQELDTSCSAREEVQRLMAAHGFDAVVQDRKGFPVVNATFFKASRFHLSWSEHRSRVLLCTLTLPDGRELGIANVHLQAGAAPCDETQRASQLKSALRRLRSRASCCEVVCGDFNSSLEATSPLRAQLMQAGLATAAGTGPTYLTPGYHDTLDHVWAGGALRPKTVLGSSSQTLKAIKATGLPDREHPSDHLPVATVFRMGSGGGPVTGLPSVEPPTEVSEALRDEWLLVLRSAPPPGAPKCKSRDQRRLEAAFLATAGADEAERLSAWRAAAAEAASEVLRLVTCRAVMAANAAAAAAADQVVLKGFDPGGCAVAGGA